MRWYRARSCSRWRPAHVASHWPRPGEILRARTRRKIVCSHSQTKDWVMRKAIFWIAAFLEILSACQWRQSECLADRERELSGRHSETGARVRGEASGAEVG